MAGLFDGNLVAYSTEGSRPALTQVAAHAGAVSAVSLWEGNGAGAAPSALLTAATGGHDAVVRLWRGDAAPAALPAPTTGRARAGSVSSVAGGRSGGGGSGLALSQVVECVGALGALHALALAPSGDRVVAGDATGAVSLWDASLPRGSAAAPTPAPPAGKRPRTRSASDAGAGAGGGAAAAAAAGGAPEERSAAAVLPKAHTDAVTGVAWLSSASFATGGWDHAIQVWDAEAAGTPVTVAAMLAPKAIHGLAASPLGSLLAAAHSDASVRLWDPRGRTAADGAASAPTGSGARIAGMRGVGTAAGSAGWMTGVAWHPTSQHHLATACQDGTVALWDTRALVAPLFALHRHTDKALAVAWAAGGTLAVSGGADKSLRAAALPADSPLFTAAS